MNDDMRRPGAAAPPTIPARDKAVYIRGAWHTGCGDKPLEAVDPSSGKVFADIAPASAKQVSLAGQAAAEAFSEWRSLSGAARAGHLRGFSDGLRARKDELVALQMRNNGKPRSEAMIDVDDAAAAFDYYAALAADLDGRQGGGFMLADPGLADPGLAGRTYFEPLGPAALIVPWNFPLVTTAWKLAPALAAGCTAVLKPSEFTTLAELVYGDLADETGLPAGVLNILPGAGAIGAALVADPGIAKVSFTGSNATGRQVMAGASERTLPLSLELGGKSPIIVLDDADVEKAAEIAAAGIFFNCGQMCSATSRLLVADSIADDVIAVLRAKTRRMVVDSPDNPHAEMGPITTEAQRAKILTFFLKARVDGLKCLEGGVGRTEADGFFVEPTLYLDVPFHHPIWREEIFGPVLAIARFSDEAEAVALANDTEFGLAATIVGGDPDRAQRLARHVVAGHIWINTPQIIFPNTSWGGFKASGIGRELGPHGLAAYSAVKHLTVATRQEAKHA